MTHENFQMKLGHITEKPFGKDTQDMKKGGYIVIKRMMYNKRLGPNKAVSS